MKRINALYGDGEIFIHAFRNGILPLPTEGTGHMDILSWVDNVFIPLSLKILSPKNCLKNYQWLLHK